jgi:hypothetical protein
MRLALASLALLALAGCKHTFQYPYSPAQLRADSERWPGDALVHYLGQTDADIAVCSRTPPPLVVRTDGELVGPFVAALEEQALRPDTWQACATRLVPALPPESQELTWEGLARVVRSLFGGGPDAAPRLIAAHEVLASRPRTPSPALTGLARELGEYPRDRLAPPLVPLFDTVLGTLELEAGRFQGHVVTGQDIVNTQDDGLLLRMATRLPDTGLREQAKKRLVQLRIERSPTREVKERAAEVELAVLQTGRWAQPARSLEGLQPQQPFSLPYALLARQDVRNQRVSFTVLNQADVQVAHAVELGALVSFEVGWSRPLVVCLPPGALSVEPCIDERELEVASADVTLDAEGRLQLPEELSLARLVELARADEGLVLPVRLGGRLATSLSVPVRLLTPPSIIFEGDHGMPGPAVNVVVQPARSALLFSTVSELNERRLAVLPRAAPGEFEVVSRGGEGLPGEQGLDGYDGARGSDGHAAQCPSQRAGDGGTGGDGSRGGDGGPGGPGGAGGFVSVTLQCGGSCPAEEQWSRRIVHSRGGAGGEGGRGGNGGRGGAGGHGGTSASCRSGSLPAGNTGRSGSDGPRGRRGPSGPDGRDGLVQFTVE